MEEPPTLGFAFPSKSIHESLGDRLRHFGFQTAGKKPQIQPLAIGQPWLSERHHCVLASHFCNAKGPNMLCLATKLPKPWMPHLPQLL